MAQYEAQRAEIVAGQAQSLRARIENGERIILYESVYLPVDSLIANEAMSEEFSISVLRQLGLDGWDVVAVIPRTIGVALTNTSFGSTSGETWGAGMGGNVAGVHLLLKREVSSQNNASDELLKWYSARNLDDFAA